MTTTYLIRNARVLGGEPTDLLLRDGIIAEIGAGLTAEGAEVIDADGLIALPGLVDLHTHLREPGREDAETVDSGTSAAALGGFTAVHAMAEKLVWQRSTEKTRSVLEGARNSAAPQNPPTLYANHPPLVPLLISGVYAVLGDSEWQTRLMPALFTIGSACLIFAMLVRSAA